MYLVLVYLFALIGIIFIYLDLDLPSYYMAVVLFFNFKWIFNYRQCTISYLECVVRGVKRKNGLLNSFLDGIIDLRYGKHIALFYNISFFIIVYQYFYKGNRLHNF